MSAMTKAIQAMGEMVAQASQGEVPSPEDLSAVLADLEQAQSEQEAPAAPGAFDKVLAAIQAVMEEVRSVPKRGRNSFHGYDYVLAADLLAVLQPACVKHGLVIFPSVEGFPVTDAHGNTTVVMTYRIAHTSGQFWPWPVRVPGAGNDYSVKTNRVGDKGVFKALTGTQKYFLQQMFLVPTGVDVDTATDAEHDGIDREHGEARRNQNNDRRSQQNNNRQNQNQRPREHRLSEPREDTQRAKVLSAEEAARKLNADEAAEVRAAAAAKGLDTDEKLLPFLRNCFRGVDLNGVEDLIVLHKQKLLHQILPKMTPAKNAQ